MALSVMVVGICLFTTAHTSDNGPEEFVLGFMYNPPASESDGPLEVYVTSRSTSDIRGNVSYSTVYQTFILYPLTSLRIDISVLLVMMQKYQSRGQKGVVVNTDRKDVNVVCLTKQNGSSDGFMSIPTSNLGQVYRACVYFPFSRKSQIAVIGVKNNTSVVITLSANANASGAQFGPLVYNPGDSISATINRLEVIAVQSTGDLSGSRVTADQKVVFYSGNSNTEVNGAGPGHLVEQLVPVNQWGTKFIVPSTLPNGTVTVKVISDTTCPTAVIAKICTHFFAASYEYFVLKSILTFEIQYQYNCFFSSDEPVMMVMYVAMSNTTKDPTMTIIPDVEHFDDTYAFEAPPTKRNSPALEIVLVLVVKEEHKDSLLLSGNSFSDSLTFDSVLDTSFVVGITTISTGYHTLQASGDFLAIIFGIDVGESYSFPLGLADVDYNSGLFRVATDNFSTSNRRFTYYDRRCRRNIMDGAFFERLEFSSCCFYRTLNHIESYRLNNESYSPNL
ncbi:IgGFc-binding protein-like [Mizuhopecten yessoensis]|uniref:IgGFc-binding protein-like n=1 Tax=Mizuhopecten yessoensis TaxID=6573 RepID=UPI000B45BBAA|nr:IgGFc-binding protein-like [Mizuhopecten yessoensis]